MYYDIEIDSDHFQVFFGDRVYGPKVDTRGLWSSGNQLVSATEDVVAIGTARFGGKTRIRVEVGSKEPETEVGWSEMGAFQLNVRSGELLFWAPESLDLTRAPVVPIAPGNYLGRALSWGTETVIDEMAPEGLDIYRLVLWRTP